MAALGETISYRPMTSGDLDACMGLKDLAGWNQQRRDWELFLQFHPRGCSVACVGPRIVGTVTSIDYHGRFSWIGMVLVHLEFRRRGIGTALMNAATEALATCETVKLDATPTGKTLYDRLGFVDEYTLARMTADALTSTDSPTADSGVTPVTPQDCADLGRFDAPIFGAERGNVLRAWYERMPSAAFMIRRDGGIKGYVMARPGANYATIGPLVAECQADARALLLSVVQTLSGSRLCMDILRHTPGFQAWLETLGFEYQRPFIRMFRGPNRSPGLPSRQWSILGPELG